MKNKFENISTPVVVGALVAVGLIFLAQIWLFQLVLSWFGLQLAFWKCAVAVILIKSITSSSNAD